PRPRVAPAYIHHDYRHMRRGPLKYDVGRSRPADQWNPVDWEHSLNDDRAGAHKNRTPMVALGPALARAPLRRVRDPGRLVPDPPGAGRGSLLQGRLQPTH